MRLAKPLIATVGIPEAPTTCRLMPVNNKWPNPFASVSRVTLLNRLLSSFTSASVRKHRQSLKHWSDFASWRPSPKEIWSGFAKLWSLPGRHPDHWLPQVLLVPPGREAPAGPIKTIKPWLPCGPCDPVALFCPSTPAGPIEPAGPWGPGVNSIVFTWVCREDSRACSCRNFLERPFPPRSWSLSRSPFLFTTFLTSTFFFIDFLITFIRMALFF